MPCLTCWKRKAHGYEEVPPLGESVKQAILVAWHKKEGESVAIDEPICELETDKANVDVPAKTAGVLHHLKEEGETVNVGEAIARIDEGPAGAEGGFVKFIDGDSDGGAEVGGGERFMTAPHGEDLSPAVRRLVEEHQLNPKTIPATGPGGRLTKEDVETFVKHRKGMGRVSSRRLRGTQAPPSAASARPRASADADSIGPALAGVCVRCQRDSSRADEQNSQAHRRDAGACQQTAAILTTFNEVDLSEVINLRTKFREQFEKVYGVTLGFVSFLRAATVLALKEVPRLNSFIDGNDIVYHNYVNLGIAVSTDRGLAVPVLRNVQDMSFCAIEAESSGWHRRRGMESCHWMSCRAERSRSPMVAYLGRCYRRRFSRRHSRGFWACMRFRSGRWFYLATIRFRCGP